MNHSYTDTVEVHNDNVDWNSLQELNYNCALCLRRKRKCAG